MAADLEAFSFAAGSCDLLLAAGDFSAILSGAEVQQVDGAGLDVLYRDGQAAATVWARGGEIHALVLEAYIEDVFGHTLEPNPEALSLFVLNGGRQGLITASPFDLVDYRLAEFRRFPASLAGAMASFGLLCLRQAGGHIQYVLNPRRLFEGRWDGGRS